jgi:hypothetical protein
MGFGFGVRGSEFRGRSRLYSDSLEMDRFGGVPKGQQDSVAWPAPEGASPLARRHRNPIGLYPPGAVIEDFAPEPGTPRAGSEKNCIQIIINYARPLILRDVLDDDFVRLARL